MTLATGEGDLLFMGMLQTLPHVKAGRLKLIAVSSEKRDPNLPNVPTVSETAGLEGFVTGSYQGIMGPSKIPADIVNKFNAEVNRIISKLDDQQHVFYMDIGQKFLDEKGVFLPDSFRADNLHPQAKGYDIWGAAVKDKLAKNAKKYPAP